MCISMFMGKMVHYNYVCLVFLDLDNEPIAEGHAFALFKEEQF